VDIDTYNLKRFINSMSTLGDPSISELTEIITWTSSERSLRNNLGISTLVPSSSNLNRHSLSYNLISSVMKNGMIDEVVPRYTDTLIDQ
jgi:hypothetical protein